MAYLSHFPSFAIKDHYLVAKENKIEIYSRDEEKLFGDKKFVIPSFELGRFANNLQELRNQAIIHKESLQSSITPLCLVFGTKGLVEGKLKQQQQLLKFRN